MARCALRKRRRPSIATAAGLDRDDVLRALLDGEHLGAVHADQRLAAELGIQAVPFLVVDGRCSVSGAQPAEVFAQALATVAGERAEAAA